MGNSQSADKGSLTGFKVLVVEDDYLVAKELVTTLNAHGAVVMGPVADVTSSRALLTKAMPDCAVLDVNLKGLLVFELAEELVHRGVPPIFTTGYDCSFLPPQFSAAPCLLKPIDMRSLIRSIREQTVDRGYSNC